MKIVILATLLFVAAGAKVPYPESTDDGRIVGGNPTTIQQYPHQVAIIYRSNLLCGGSLISKRMVLTAAHCTTDMWASALRVRAGSTNYYIDGQVLTVSRMVRHPGFNRETLDYDVALLTLGQEVTTTAARPIAVRSSLPSVGSALTVTGWGDTSQGGNPSNVLRAVQVSLLAQTDCQRRYSGTTVTSRMWCATASGKDACQGDSGGPIIYSGGQVGVVSWGYGCASPQYPGVYTNLANSDIRGFIDSNMV